MVPRDVLMLFLPSRAGQMDPRNLRITSSSLTWNSYKLAGENGNGGALQRNQRELGADKEAVGAGLSIEPLGLHHLPSPQSGQQRSSTNLPISVPMAGAPRQARPFWLSGEPFPELMQMILIKDILICSISHTFCLQGG